MAQQTSPWLEGAYGWNFGESNWNPGMDQNLLKFSFLFDRNVDSIVASLPAAVNGQAHYLTTDNRLYFAVGTTYFSTVVPKWFTIFVRSTGQTHQFNGTTLVQIDSPAQLDSRLDSVELTISNLGTAALEDVGFFASSAQLDVSEAEAAAYTDTLRSDIANDSDVAKGSGQVGFKADGTDTGGRTVRNKLSNVVDISDFLKFYGDGPYSHAETLAASTLAWNHALLVGKDIYAPAGEYEIGENNYPWRQSVVVSLLDCKNITLFGDGPNTIFRTNSVGGADVFQLNGLKNFHIRNVAVEALVSGSASGSNGISVTNGWENLTVEWFWANNLGSLDKGSFIDGGKGITLQSDGATENCGSFTAKNVFIKGCAQGFGFESDLVNFLDKTVDVDVQLTAEDCFVGATIGAAAASGPVPSGTQNGVKVKLTAINCQKDLFLARVHGGSYEVDVVTTKTEADRRLSPSAVTWYAADTVVESVYCAYAKNARIVVTGDKGACAQKVRIGGTDAGSSGLSGTTDAIEAFFDIKGSPSVSDIVEVSFGGNTVTNSNLRVASGTATAFPTEISSVANNNTLIIGPSPRLASPSVTGSIGFNLTSSGTFRAGEISLQSGTIIGLKGSMSSTPGDAVVGLYDTNDFPLIQACVGGRIKLNSGLPTYADNAAAVTGGLAVTEVYKTATGELRVVV